MLKNIFIGALIVIILFLLFKGCGKTPVKPEVITNTELVKMIDSALTVRVLDSIKIANEDRHAEVVILYDRIEQLTDRSKELKYERDQAIAALENEQQRNDLTNIASATDKNDKAKDSAVNRTISNLRATITGQAKAIAEQNKYKSKVLQALDSCMKAKDQVEGYADKIKPTNKVFAGIHVMGNPGSIISGFGIQAGMIFNTGGILHLQATQYGSTINYGVGFSKVITLKRK